MRHFVTVGNWQRAKAAVNQSAPQIALPRRVCVTVFLK